MNAAELLEFSRSLAGARGVRATKPLTAIAVVNGIEVASTTLGSEHALRKVWRDRRGTGATPLLLIADDEARQGVVKAVVDAASTIRSVEAKALAAALDRISRMASRLEAIRELAAELERLDRSGIPGIRVRGLLSIHTLDVRLRTDRMSWPALEEAVKAVTPSADWRAILTSLGYAVERRRHRGWLARFEGRPVTVIHPKADPAAFGRLDEEKRPPEGILLNDCEADGAAYGILAAGPRLRLFEVRPTVGSAAVRYLDLDASVLQPDDRPFLGLFGPAYLAGGGFEDLLRDARGFGAALRLRLDDTLRQSALPVLARALGRWARAQGMDLASDGVGEELERAALTTVFRAVFLHYAESAGYLPMDNESYRRASITEMVEQTAARIADLDPASHALWDQFSTLVRVMRVGDRSRAVPPYNGALFAADGFDGAALLERVSIPDPDFGSVLVAIGRDPTTGEGIDYSTLEIGHIGHIYEGLLSLRLSLAASPLRYDAKRDAYVRAEGSDANVEAGDLVWQTNEGGRKSGGVYYTRAELVRHLVRNTVVPAFREHLRDIKSVAATDPSAAATRLFDFQVLDPACGSAHFLVHVANTLADMVVQFLGETPLPLVAESLQHLRAGASAGALIDDAALLRRLVVKRCVFGVDVSPMGVEVAKLSLWLASFVPGLSLAYLDRNVQCGNSLFGVARPEELRPAEVRDPGLKRRTRSVGEGGPAYGQSWTFQEQIERALESAAEAVRTVAEGEDRNPTEVKASEDADLEARAVAAGLNDLFNLWVAEPFGLAGARYEFEVRGADIVAGAGGNLVERARPIADEHSFLHWLPAFPRAFARENPGFDVVVGNPPWEEVTVEELAFYARFLPGLRALPERDRGPAIEKLLQERPELADRLRAEQGRVEAQRGFLRGGDYPKMPGDPDLYKLFCQRYRMLLREGGRLGVVLPRSTFAAKGSEGFRAWLFEKNTCERLDFLLNNKLWLFDTHPQYTVALVSARTLAPAKEHRISVAGTAESLAAWEVQSASPGIALAPAMFGAGWTVPLLRDEAEAAVLAKMNQGTLFPLGAGRWRCFAVAELHETNDRKLWEGAAEGRPLWKGESFEQYDPHGAEARFIPDSPALVKKVRKPNPGAGSLLADQVKKQARVEAVERELARARVAFRDVSRATDSRTVRACLVPPGVLLTNKAPYLTFVDGAPREQAACLGIMNSLPFDWQSRRFVEINLNFFILEALTVPSLTDEDFDAIAAAAARLSCVDERFAAFAAAAGVECGPLDDDETVRLRVEIDARVARAWMLTADDLAVIFSDFTTDAVSPAYRQALLDRLGSRDLVYGADAAARRGSSPRL